MPFSKPKVEIDLEEYQYLLEQKELQHEPIKNENELLSRTIKAALIIMHRHSTPEPLERFNMMMSNLGYYVGIEIGSNRTLDDMSLTIVKKNG